ncbi:MAG: glycosyltransferase [Candidatus Omnitrophica bacterium]|nr:glycosyltransferase [Candidatus Omnitrophota bacterium]
MKILMMTNTYDPIVGGLEKSIALFAKQLRKSGDDVLIAVPAFKEAKRNESGVIRVPAIQNFNGTDFSLSLPIPEMIAKQIREFKPDLVHAHHPFLMGDMAMRIAGQSHIPLVFTFHTLFDQYTAYFPLNTEAGKNFVSELAIGYANLADQVIAPSESIRDLLIERGVVETPITIIPTGVDAARFQKGNGKEIRAELKIPEQAFLVGHAGRLSPEKNLEFLSKAVVLFLKKEPKAYFLVVGRGPFLKNLYEIFSSEKVLHQVRFAGVLRGQKLVDAYHAMDVFAFASQSETQGMVVTEAMAAGVPVIALDGPGIREVIRDKRNGRLLSSKVSPAKFAEVLVGFKKQSAGLHEKMKAEALATAAEFSIENSVQKLRVIYEQAGARKYLLRRLRRSRWRMVMRRIKTEWDMLANLGKAAGTAIAEAAKPDHVLKEGKTPALLMFAG